MDMENSIKTKVRQDLAPAHFEIINESHRHAGPATDSHFKLILVSDTFEGLSPVKRHQRLYRLLADEMAGPVHALALHLYTPQEWQTQEQGAPASPNCRGGE